MKTEHLKEAKAMYDIDEINPEYLWDYASETIGDRISDLDRVAGETVMFRSDFIKCAEKIYINMAERISELEKQLAELKG